MAVCCLAFSTVEEQCLAVAIKRLDIRLPPHPTGKSLTIQGIEFGFATGPPLHKSLDY